MHAHGVGSHRGRACPRSRRADLLTPAGCALTHLGGDLSTLQTVEPVHIVNTTFADNAQFTNGDAVIYLYFSGAAVWLQGVTFARNNAPQVLLSFSGNDVYSDRTVSYYSRLEGGYAAALTTPGAGSDFLSLQDPIFQTATAVRPLSPLPRASAQALLPVPATRSGAAAGRMKPVL